MCETGVFRWSSCAWSESGRSPCGSRSWRCCRGRKRRNISKHGRNRRTTFICTRPNWGHALQMENLCFYTCMHVIGSFVSVSVMWCRSKIRIRDGRAKPIDLLAKYISAEDDDLSVEMHEPYTFLNGLTATDMEDLLEDIKVCVRERERNNRLTLWLVQALH